MSQVYDEPIVVRLTVPVGSYPVGTEFGFNDVADAIRALGSSSYFTVVRTQDGDPIPPPTPEDMTEAERQALARARAARLIRGKDFDPLVPGPGEVIVGSEDGPVAVDSSTIGGDVDPALVADRVTTELAGRSLANRQDIPLVVFPTLVGTPDRSYGPTGVHSPLLTGDTTVESTDEGDAWRVTSAGDVLFYAEPKGTPPTPGFGYPARPDRGAFAIRLSPDANPAATALLGRVLGIRIQRITSGAIRTYDGENFVNTGAVPENGQPSTILVVWRESNLSIWLNGEKVAASTTLAPQAQHDRVQFTDRVAPQPGLYYGGVILPDAVSDEDAAQISSMTMPDLADLTVNTLPQELRSYTYSRAEVDALVASSPGGSAATIAAPKVMFREQVSSVTIDGIRGMSRGGDTIYFRQGKKILQTRDSLNTVQEVLEAVNAVQGVELLDDGELLFSVSARTTEPILNTSIYKTRGYNRLAGTVDSVDKVMESPHPDGIITGHWGLSVHGPVIVAGEYGSKNETGSRYAWLSQDYGETWSVIFDQMTTPNSIPGAPAWSDGNSHIHTVLYDPYRTRIWIICGDQPATATYYSDDMGGSWTFVNIPSPKGPMQMQFTGGIALPDGVVLGTDAPPTGLWGWRASSGSDPVVFEEILHLNNEPSLTHVFKRAFRRWGREGEMVLFPGTVSTILNGSVPPTLTALTSLDNAVELDWNYAATFGALDLGPEQVVGPDVNGDIWTVVNGKAYRATAPFILGG